jgi:hypothetical protein
MLGKINSAGFRNEKHASTSERSRRRQHATGGETAEGQAGVGTSTRGRNGKSANGFAKLKRPTRTSRRRARASSQFRSAVDRPLALPGAEVSVRVRGRVGVAHLEQGRNVFVP